MMFGTDTYPTVAAAGSGAFGGQCGGGATLAYPGGGLATVSMPSGEFDEVFEIRGTEGTITIETPGHCELRSFPAARVWRRSVGQVRGARRGNMGHFSGLKCSGDWWT